MLNIGKETESQLLQVGIHDAEELKKVGSKEAWLKIKEIDSGACLHLLYGLEATVEGVKKKDLDKKIKAELKVFFDLNK